MNTTDWGALSLSHYSKNSNIEPYSEKQRGMRYDKPDGFWVSVDGDDDWPSWCADAEYPIGEHRHRVTLAPAANILHLATPGDLMAFDLMYGVSDGFTSVRFRIDWERVAEQYQGIIIAPYQWSLCLDGPSWYYTWDCASGCIWEPAAIEAVTLYVH